MRRCGVGASEFPMPSLAKPTACRALAAGGVEGASPAASSSLHSPAALPTAMRSSSTTLWTAP
eukprot:189578-Alexandrium_andersonii.AAC.1